MDSTTNDAAWERRGRSWWSHVRVLADDQMEGRETGSPGYERAAAYVTEQFRIAGLEPAGVEGYRQPVDLAVSTLDQGASSLTIVRDGATRSVRIPEEAQFIVTSATVSDIEADAVFVGYALEIPEHGYSDLAGLDLREKIAVFVLGGPADLPGPVRAHHQSRSEVYRALRRAGAAGFVLVQNPSVPEAPWSRFASGQLFPRMELLGSDRGERRPLPLTAAFDHEHLDLLFEGSGHRASEVLASLGKPGPLPRFPLAVRLRAHVEVRRSTARCTNVVGVLPGSDPTLRHEYVVGTAHLDHLGIGEPIHGDSIYSGAMDNASGVAALIEIARAMKDAAERPRRSILFAAVTAEEQGLLGSEHFANHPTVSGPIVADLNMDMFLPLFPLRFVEVQGLDESTLGPTLRAAAHQVGVTADAEYLPDRKLFIRSDQYSFVKTGVPALMVSIGYARGSPEEQAVVAFLRDRYHAPADDADQPVNLTAAAQFTDLLRRVILQVANDPGRPQWNPDSFFRRFAR
ncbi:MAG TPA: M20/M25/M40 family metallo-hydrolase [Thermoplasmata archaeon]|nr:M20/M25/M40 family metallo-hydrolase [Thermoplasmata archaeon]